MKITMTTDGGGRVFSWFASKAEVSTFENLDYACVYAVGTKAGRPLRIGWARRPFQRIQALQEGHWQALVIHDLVWVPGQELARRLDDEVQRILKQGNRHLSGNWHDITPDWVSPCFSVASGNLKLNTWKHDEMLANVRAIHQRRVDAQVRALRSC